MDVEEAKPRGTLGGADINSFASALRLKEGTLHPPNSHEVSAYLEVSA
jgi:hypothetical protein